MGDIRILNGGAEEPSAAMQVNDTERGALIPRHTTTSRNAIPSPATGLLVINITTNTLDMYNGTAWVALSPATSPTLTNPAVSGSLTFSDAAARIKGDLTNATHANRLLFQTTTANSATSVGAIPSGTGNQGAFYAYNASDPDNAGILELRVTTTQSIVGSNKTGTGTAVPLSLQVGGTTYFQVYPGGKILFGPGGTPLAALDLGSTTALAFDTVDAMPTDKDAYGLMLHTGSAGSAPFDQAGSMLYRSRVSSNPGRSRHYFFTGSPSTEKLRIDETGNLKIMAVGGGLFVTEGSNATMGLATLSSGTVVVSTTKVTANSRILLTGQNNNVTGALRVSARTASVSFTITSSNAGDSGTVAWMIVEPS